MIYDNQDRYLLLKQLLVTICLVAKKANLNVNGSPLILEEQQGKVIQLITEIQDNFTIPYGLLRGGSIYLYLDPICNHLSGLSSGKLPTDCWENDYIIKLEDRDALADCILHYPLTEEYVQEHAENLRDGNFYIDGRERAGELIAKTEQALTAIRRWAEGREGMTLEQAIVLCNGVELVEWIFNFTNDVKGVENGPDSDIPGC